MYPLKLGSVFYKGPRPITLKKQKVLTIRWLVKKLSDLNKTKKISINDFVLNLIKSFEKEGIAWKMRNDSYSQAVKNRHLVWRFKN